MVFTTKNSNLFTEAMPIPVSCGHFCGSSVPDGSQDCSYGLGKFVMTDKEIPIVGWIRLSRLNKPRALRSELTAETDQAGAHAGGRIPSARRKISALPSWVVLTDHSQKTLSLVSLTETALH